jgi:hypothetical protein
MVGAFPTVVGNIELSWDMKNQIEPLTLLYQSIGGSQLRLAVMLMVEAVF